MTLEVNFKLPFMREFLLLHGVVDASKTACLMVLGKGSGQAILLAVGGAQEALLARPGTYDLVRQTFGRCWQTRLCGRATCTQRSGQTKSKNTAMCSQDPITATRQPFGHCAAAVLPNNVPVLIT
jgi:hypothetical protein